MSLRTTTFSDLSRSYHAQEILLKVTCQSALENVNESSVMTGLTATDEEFIKGIKLNLEIGLLFFGKELKVQKVDGKDSGHKSPCLLHWSLSLSP